MAESSLLGLAGEEDVYECTYTQSEVVDGLEFFSSKVQLGPNGVEAFLPLGAWRGVCSAYNVSTHPSGTLSDYERKALEELKPVLRGNIDKGVEFVKGAPVGAA